jgi:hypothetical protein
MGYTTIVTLYVYQDNHRLGDNALKASLNGDSDHIIDHDFVMMMNDEYGTDVGITWITKRKDKFMATLSSLFSHFTFELNGKGDDVDDQWNELWENGKRVQVDDENVDVWVFDQIKRHHFKLYSDYVKKYYTHHVYDASFINYNDVYVNKDKIYQIMSLNLLEDQLNNDIINYTKHYI